MSDDRYPNVPGSKGGHGTSEAAAAEVGPVTANLQKLVLTAVTNAGARGLTADEVAADLDLSRWSVQPRTSELKARGKIVASGQHRRNVSGKSAVVWTLPEFGPTAKWVAA